MHTDPAIIEARTHNFLSFVRSYANQVSNDPGFSPEFHTVLKWKKDPSENDSSTTLIAEEIEEADWSFIIELVSKDIIKTDEANTFRVLLDSWGASDSAYLLQKIVKKALFLTFDSPNSDLKSKIIQPMIADLFKEPQPVWSQIKLRGISIESVGFQLSDQILLRQPNPDDIVSEYTPQLPGQRPHIHAIECIGSVKITTNREKIQVLQYEVEKLVAFLRLTKVASVTHDSYTLESDSLTGISNGIIWSTEQVPSILKKISTAEEGLITSFFGAIYPLIPENMYYTLPNSSVLRIAYDFYVSATTERNTAERSIAFAMMGLEALFSNDNHEIGFKLSTRIAKLFSLLKYDPIIVRKKLKDAYSVRSAFAHGGVLEKNKLRKENQDLFKFRDEILNYLRVVIILFILLKMNKAELLSELDDSLVSGHGELLTRIMNLRGLPYFYLLSNEYT